MDPTQVTGINTISPDKGIEWTQSSTPLLIAREMSPEIPATVLGFDTNNRDFQEANALGRENVDDVSPRSGQPYKRLKVSHPNTEGVSTFDTGLASSRSPASSGRGTPKSPLKQGASSVMSPPPQHWRMAASKPDAAEASRTSSEPAVASSLTPSVSTRTVKRARPEKQMPSSAPMRSRKLDSKRKSLLQGENNKEKKQRLGLFNPPGAYAAQGYTDTAQGMPILDLKNLRKADAGTPSILPSSIPVVSTKADLEPELIQLAGSSTPALVGREIPKAESTYLAVPPTKSNTRTLGLRGKVSPGASACTSSPRDTQLHIAGMKTIIESPTLRVDSIKRECALTSIPLTKEPAGIDSPMMPLISLAYKGDGSS